jgi:hypothetical protein
MENDKDKSKALDMTWDYFKLLAQQRVTHFNLFIVFIGAITAALVVSVHTDLRGNIIACTLSFFQVFLCFIFHKIDIRNKFLIKHTESIIKNIEKSYENDIYKVFLMEEKSTNALRDKEKSKLYCARQLSTSQLYNLFYFFFMLMGFSVFVFSIILIVQSI